MTKPVFIDVHCHIQEPEFDTDRQQVVDAMRAAGVGAFVVGTDQVSSKKAVALVQNNDDLSAIIGIHPTDKPDEVFRENEFTELLHMGKVVGIGECGLDYYRMEGDIKKETHRQKDLFEAQLEFAVAHDLPLMIHCRNSAGKGGGAAGAHADMIGILRSKDRTYGEKLRGNIHFFTADIPTAKQYFELGFTISFPGVITFTHEYDEVVRYAPTEMILSETDTPYASPVPHRGTRNDPTRVSLIADKIAEIRGVDPEGMHAQLVDNATRIFKIT